MQTFSQGIHLEYQKQRTEEKSIAEAAVPKKVIIPLHQHTGATCEPLVKVGDLVNEGQKIGDTAKFISAPVHASISGKVTKIDKFLHPCGANILSIVIEAQEGQSSLNFNAEELKAENDLSAEEIRKMVREAGIVGLGGAAFPTHVKLTPPEGKKIDTVLINGCECEPYITADHRVMLERFEEMLSGAKLIAKATGAKKVIFAIENNKKNAIKNLRSKITTNPNHSKMEVVELETKYPQGGEKMLIKAVLNREVPSKGLPLDVGVVVLNVGTAVAVAEAVTTGIPLIKRVLTVTGSGVKEPKNLLVRIGTPFQDVINECRGLSENASQVIMGGPMMGISEFSLEVPVVKATSCILVLSREEIVEEKVYPCVKCARCVEHCPVYLMPTRLAAFAENAKYADFEDWGGQDCIECGCCAYVCPAKIPIVHWIKFAKAKLRQMK
jgi:electron transport complex protein RnfC